MQTMSAPKWTPDEYMDDWYADQFEHGGIDTDGQQITQLIHTPHTSAIATTWPKEDK